MDLVNVMYNTFNNNQSFHHFSEFQYSIYKAYKIENVILGKNYMFQW